MIVGGIGALDFGKLTGAGNPAAGAAGSAAGPHASFASMLSDVASQAVGQLRQAEQLSMEGLRGNADTRAVVDAVMSAEQSLQAAVAIRDKIVSAYMEISRMAV